VSNYLPSTSNKHTLHTDTAFQPLQPNSPPQLSISLITIQYATTRFKTTFPNITRPKSPTMYPYNPYRHQFPTQSNPSLCTAEKQIRRYDSQETKQIPMDISSAEQIPMEIVQLIKHLNRWTMCYCEVWMHILSLLKIL
jgi:hypothetical protein